MLMLRIQRDGEQAARFPLERQLMGRVVPDAGRAVARRDVHHLLVQLTLRSEMAACRNLADVGVVDAAVAVEIDERTASAAARPRPQLSSSDVLHPEAGDDWDALAPLVLLVGIDALDLGQRLRRFDGHG